MVYVKFSSALNSVTGTRATNIKLGSAEIRILFDRLIEDYGEEFEKRLFQEGEIRRFVNVYVNGEDIRYLAGLETRISDNDEISILPAVSGG